MKPPHRDAPADPGPDTDAQVERHRGALPDGPVADDAPLTLPVPLDPTHYTLLGLTEQADASAIHAAVTRLQASATRAAPSGGRDSADPDAADTVTADLRLASAVLSDPLRKPVYDAWLARERAWLARSTPTTPIDRWRQRLHRLLPLLPLALLLMLAAAAVAWLLAPR